jgi:hypothetical protein
VNFSVSIFSTGFGGRRLNSPTFLNTLTMWRSSRDAAAFAAAAGATAAAGAGDEAPATAEPPLPA